MIKLKGQSAEDLNGFMDEGTEFLGELRFRDTLRIDGRLKGKIVSDNTLVIGESGQDATDVLATNGVAFSQFALTGQFQSGNGSGESMDGLVGLFAC